MKTEHQVTTRPSQPSETKIGISLFKSTVNTFSIDFHSETSLNAIKLIKLETPQEIQNVTLKCNNEIFTPFSLNGVKRQRKVRNVELTKCDMCEFKAKRTRELLRHKRNLHQPKAPEGQKLLICFRCSFETSEKSKMLRHLERVHEAEEHNCPHCEYRSVRKDNYLKHVKEKHSQDKFVCDLCEFEVIGKYQFDKHMVLHKGNKLYCQQCKFVCKSKPSLRKHIARHKNKSSKIKLKLVCSMCEFSCPTKLGLTRHSKKLHDVKMIIYDEKYEIKRIKPDGKEEFKMIKDDEKEEIKIEINQEGSQHQNIPSTTSIAEELLSVLDNESKGEVLNTEPLLLQVEEAEETFDKHKFEKIYKECQKNIPVVHVVQSKQSNATGETDLILKLNMSMLAKEQDNDPLKTNFADFDSSDVKYTLEAPDEDETVEEESYYESLAIEEGIVIDVNEAQSLKKLLQSEVKSSNPQTGKEDLKMASELDADEGLNLKTDIESEIKPSNLKSTVVDEGLNMEGKYKYVDKLPTRLKEIEALIEKNGLTWLCKACGKRATTGSERGHLKWHVEIHLEGRPNSCPFCPKKFKSRTNVAAHIFDVHNNKHQACDLCKFTSTRKRLLIVHKLVKHEGMSRAAVMEALKATPLGPKIPRGSIYKCDKCDFTAIRSSTVREHQELEHEGKVYSCPSCPGATSFKNKKCLIRHKGKVHAKNGFACDECDFKSNYKLHYERHKNRTHGGVMEKVGNLFVYNCIHCAQSFTRRKLLDNHLIKDHGGTKHMNEDLGEDILCSICKQKFNSNSNLKSHMTFIHEQNSCDKCDYTNKKRVKVMQHISELHHNLEKLSIKCLLCKFSSETREIMKVHKRYNHQETKKECDKCDFKITRTNHFYLLLRHKQTEHGNMNNDQMIVKRKRTVFSNQQLEVMEKLFKEKKSLSLDEREDLGTELGLTSDQVRHWFRRRGERDQK